MEPLIEVVRIDEEKYVCRILLTYFEYMRINSKAKIKISIYRDKDIFLYNTMTKTKKEKNDSSSGGGGSSTHTTSSGSTAGGGGGKF